MNASMRAKIEQARKLLKLKEDAKWEICKIAKEICYIPNKKGGRVPDDAYTITRFANDIGMNRKTLSCWLLDYEVFLKLDEATCFDTMTFTERKKFMGLITRTRKNLFNMNEHDREHMQKASKKEVNDVFKMYSAEDPIVLRIDDFIKNLRHHIYTLKTEEFNTKKREKALLKYSSKIVELYDLLDEMGF